jgi:hypothetical protein
MLITRFFSLVVSPPIAGRTIPREHGIHVDVVVASHADQAWKLTAVFLSAARRNSRQPTKRRLSLAGRRWGATFNFGLADENRRRLDGRIVVGLVPGRTPGGRGLVVAARRAEQR